MTKINGHKVIYEWEYVVPNGDPSNPDDIGDRLEVRKYDDGGISIACFAYEDNNGKRDALVWFNNFSDGTASPQELMEALREAIDA